MRASIWAKVDERRGFIAGLTVARDVLFAVGGTNSETTILASADGRHLHPCATPHTSGLRGVVAGRDGRLWVVGEYGLIAVSDDQGSSWTNVASGTNGCLYGIAHDARGDLIICGDDGFVATSRDGRKWKRVALKIPCKVSRVVTIDSEDFLLRGDGKITIWDGKRAVAVATGFDKPLTGLAQRAGTLWVVGDEGTCARSVDRGRTWKKVMLPVQATWEAIARIGDELIIVGGGGAALLSKGETFRPLKTGTDEHLWSICPVDGGAFVGGEGGLLLRIEDPKKPIWKKRKDALATRPGPDDRHFADDLSQFLAKRFAGFIQAKPGSAAKLADFEPVWGVKPPPELALLSKMFNAPKRDLDEWSFEHGGLPNPPKTKNLFELIVTRDQKNYLGTGLFEAFGGLHFIGYRGSDYYLIETLPKEKGRHQIIHFDHETFEFSPFADSANSLALLTSASTAQGEHRLSQATSKRITEFLSKRVAKYEGDPTALQRIWRARWMIYLFRQDGVYTVEDIPEFFDARFNPPLTDELYRRIRSRLALPPVMLWGLWCAFFFHNETWLNRLLPLARKNRSRLVRDAALLVEEFLGGRKKLGTIANIFKLRESFLALDLDPARAEARAKEKKAAAKQEAKSKKAAAATTKKAVAGGADLVELAWNAVADKGRQEALWKTARTLPAMADPLRRLDWLAAGSWNREGRGLDHEVEEVVEIFLDKLTDDAAALLVPLWVGRVVTASEWGHPIRLLRDLARRRPLDPRVAEVLRPLLAIPERYEFRRRSVLWVLGAMKDCGSVDTIVKLLDVAKPTKGPYYLDFGDHEDLLKSAFWALAEIGDRRAGPAVLDKLRKWGKTAHRMNVYMARALRTVGDESAVDLLLDLSKLLHDQTNHDRGVTEMLWAAFVLGAKVSAAKKKQWAARLPPRSKYRRNINLALDLAMRSFTGKAPLLASSVTELLTDPRSASDWEKMHIEMALRALLDTDLPVELARPYALGEDLVFRRLANEILVSRGEKPVAVKKVDLFELEGTSDEALEAMLADDRQLFRSRVVDYSAATKRTVLRPAIIARVRSLLKIMPVDQRDLSTEHEYALFWAVKGLIALGLDDATRALFDDLLKHPSRAVKDPVLRYAPRDRALEPGMKHVLEENWAWQASAARAWLKSNRR